MTLPGWNSLDSVTRISSGLEVAALVCWVLLVLLEIAARLWKRFAKTLDALALVAFALAVSGEVAGHKYNHRKDALRDQHEVQMTNDFDAQLQAAQSDTTRAKEAAQQSFTLSVQAQQQAAVAQSDADALRKQAAFRTLTDEQRTTLLSLLKPDAPQDLYILGAPDAESTSYADQISDALNAAGWKTAIPPYNWGTIERYPEGVEILVSDVHNAPRGAAMLQLALKKIGIGANGVNFAMVGDGKFALFIGLKPKPKN